MNYREIRSDDEIRRVLEELRVNYKNLSNIHPANEYSTTMGGKKVVTLYHRLEPAMKVEAEEDLLERFIARFKEETKGYSSR